MSCQISDIQLHGHKHVDGKLLWENVVYTRQNQDGTRDRVERDFMSGPNAQRNLSPSGTPQSGEYYWSLPTDGSGVIRDLRAYINAAEKGPLPLSNPAADPRMQKYCNGLFTGKLISVMRLPPTQEQVAAQQAQKEQALAARVQSLTATLTALTNTNARKDTEIATLTQLVIQTNALLQHALGF